MWTKLFTCSDAVARHQAGPIADHVVRCGAKLLDEGYSADRVLHYIYCWERFGMWLHEQTIALHEIDEDVVERYLDAQIGKDASECSNNASQSWRARQYPALRYLLTCWRAEGHIPLPVPVKVPPTWYDAGLEAYQTYLIAHRGLMPSTVWGILHELRLFLASLSAGSWDEALAKMTVATMDTHLLSRGREIGGSSRVNLTSALRGFFRYLFQTGQLSRDIAQFVPSFQTWRLSELPVTVPWEAVRETLDGIDRQTTKGKRDYAMMQLVVTYGLRAGEVINLRLEDIDWRSHRLLIRTSKNRRSREYPLLPEVRDALLIYIREVRSHTTCREVFFRTVAPRTPLRHGSLYSIARACIKEAGVSARRWGPHTIRHAFAIHLLESECSLKTIGDMLGHRRVESTYIYTKAPYDMLREVALDLTEVLS